MNPNKSLVCDVAIKRAAPQFNRYKAKKYAQL